MKRGWKKKLVKASFNGNYVESKSYSSINWEKLTLHVKFSKH